MYTKINYIIKFAKYLNYWFDKTHPSAYAGTVLLYMQHIYLEKKKLIYTTYVMH